MAFSCFLGKISSPVLRGQGLASFNKKLVPNCCINIVRQPNQLESCEISAKSFCIQNRQSVSLLNVNKQFSTSSARLAQHRDHDHSKLWTFERILAASLLPLTPAALIYPSQQLDTALAVLIVLHTHFGLEAIVVDYIRPIIFGNIIPKISLVLLYLLSIMTLAGLLNLIYNDTGLANTIINIWKK